MLLLNAAGETPSYPNNNAVDLRTKANPHDAIEGIGRVTRSGVDVSAGREKPDDPGGKRWGSGGPAS